MVKLIPELFGFSLFGTHIFQKNLGIRRIFISTAPSKMITTRGNERMPNWCETDNGVQSEKQKVLRKVRA